MKYYLGTEKAEIKFCFLLSGIEPYTANWKYYPVFVASMNLESLVSIIPRSMSTLARITAYLKFICLSDVTLYNN